jgi:hypothetical protein
MTGKSITLPEPCVIVQVRIQSGRGTEGLARRAVRIALHHHRAVANVRQEDRCDVRVVLDEHPLRDAAFGPEGFCEIREADFFLVDEKLRVAVGGNFDAGRFLHDEGCETDSTTKDAKASEYAWAADIGPNSRGVRALSLPDICKATFQPPCPPPSSRCAAPVRPGVHRQPGPLGARFESAATSVSLISAMRSRDATAITLTS